MKAKVLFILLIAFPLFSFLHGAARVPAELIPAWINRDAAVDTAELSQDDAARIAADIIRTNRTVLDRILPDCREAKMKAAITMMLIGVESPMSEAGLNDLFSAAESFLAPDKEGESLHLNFITHTFKAFFKLVLLAKSGARVKQLNKLVKIAIE